MAQIEPVQVDVGVDAEARRALRMIGPAPKNWVPDRDGVMHNVFIVGGGQSGTVLAYALRRAGIGRVSVIDEAPLEAEAGIWLTAARMLKLRTPKSVPGPELGVPALSFQSWYEARHSAAEYAAIDRIARTDWAAYLRWYRTLLGIEVRYGTRLLRIEPADGAFRLHVETAGARAVETARKVILANGFLGAGGGYVPPEISQSLPRERYAHTADRIDFAALRGKSVSVIGGAAAAFDAAAVALENGAASVDQFVRRPSLAALPVTRTRGYAGAYDNYPALPDALRWSQALRFLRAGSTATTDAIERVTPFANFALHLGASWTAARIEDDRIAATTSKGPFHFDYVIAGTGYYVDTTARPELADIAPQVRLWRDQYIPPPGQEDDALSAHPYLGAGHEYLEETEGAAAYLRDIHVFNPAAFVSFGLPIGDVPCMRRDVPSLVARISRDLFLADVDAHARRMDAPVLPELEVALYLPSVAPRVATD